LDLSKWHLTTCSHTIVEPLYAFTLKFGLKKPPPF
jgi:hypothetical protein